MKRIIVLSFIVSILILVFSGIIFYFNKAISVTYPFDLAVFPPEFPSTTFNWEAKSDYNGNWELKITCLDKAFRFDTIIANRSWKPSESLWNTLKIASKNNKIKFSVRQVGKIGNSSISFSFSADSVSAPIFYRQMPIPFIIAEQFLDSMNFKLVDVGSSNPPHTAMKDFLVCGNCHSFSKDGDKIGLDLDAGMRDKGGYFISSIKDSMLFNIDNYMSWTKIEKRRTFGLFSKLSPNGRYIVTTVKDRVLIYNFPYDPSTNAFSQLFFPVNGHLGIYDLETRQFYELSGANLNEYVQTNATWTPDGKNIVFCRAKALPYLFDSLELNLKDDQLIDKYVRRTESFKYDLCMIPFNNGKGGTAVPIDGASNNDKSNYFPAVSPDGKWIIYCEADNFMLLQPDSKLHIVPLNGGKTKELNCNLNLMNSWHSWSPNGKWIVFVSKGLSIYTDMFLSHIDNKGNASVPVLIENSRQPRRVTNYPEFVNIKADTKFNMIYDFVELSHIHRALDNKDIDKAKKLYEKYKLQDPVIYPDDFQELMSSLKRMELSKDIDYWKPRIVIRK